MRNPEQAETRKPIKVNGLDSVSMGWFYTNLRSDVIEKNRGCLQQILDNSGLWASMKAADYSGVGMIRPSMNTNLAVIHSESQNLGAGLRFAPVGLPL
jgi:hypothetical protein